MEVGGGVPMFVQIQTLIKAGRWGGEDLSLCSKRRFDVLP